VTNWIELRDPSGQRRIPLTGDRVSIGKAPENDVVAAGDGTASRLHAVLERYASGWSIRDLGSRNGTYVNGEPITAERALRPGDEITIGETRFVFRAEVAATRSDTALEPATSGTIAADPAPDITRREHDVLLELCRPVLGGSLLTEPSSVREIADALVVTESAVKKHLGRLYDKFTLLDEADRRRGKLAAAAIRRGAVTLGDLRSKARGPDPS
jgi:pSer/pThr/pTyr-binding forkhead associated (FHA) protein